MPCGTGWAASGSVFRPRSTGRRCRCGYAITDPALPRNERERIFEPFYRGEQTRISRVPGTGLGLSLVKNTIERYKGKVEVNNSPGGGAQFTVRLPALHQTT